MFEMICRSSVNLHRHMAVFSKRTPARRQSARQRPTSAFAVRDATRADAATVAQTGGLGGEFCKGINCFFDTGWALEED